MKIKKVELLKKITAAVVLLIVVVIIKACQQSSVQETLISEHSNGTQKNINLKGATVTFDEDLDVIPAGWMSGGGASEVMKFISLETSDDCYMDTVCLKFEYSTGGSWGGVMWWPLSCGTSGASEASWTNVKSGTCGINLLERGNISGITRLTFWARGEKGQEFIEFKVGDRNILPTPGKRAKFRLSSNWTKYEIDLNGGNMDFTNAIAILTWITNDIQNPNGAVFYLDDIQFEGVQ